MSIVPNNNLNSTKCDNFKTEKPAAFRCSIDLEYADTHSEQVLGLSGRESMAKDSGMLFIYDYPDTRCMWMKDMRFSLDMIWLDRDQKVLKIAKAVSPDTFPQTFCAGNTQYVIELNAGMADKLGYKIGDYIKL